MTPVPTVFLGSDEIALPLLEALTTHLSSEIKLEGVWTQPDKPHGRGMKLMPNAIKQWATGRGLEVLQPHKIGDEEHAWLKEKNIELILVMAYGHILRKEFLSIPKYPVLNFHASLLPEYRGASPINAAIAAGDAVSGVSLMQIVRKLDAGAVYGQEKVTIDPEDTAVELAVKLGECCAPLLLRELPLILRGESVATPQDESKVSFTRLLTREDAYLDFHVPAKCLVNRVRALQPWPGAACKLAENALKIGAVRLGPERDAVGFAPGTVVESNPKTGLIVATGEGTLEILSLQRPGGKMLPSSEFLRGFPIPQGTQLVSQPMRPLSQKEPFQRPVVSPSSVPR